MASNRFQFSGEFCLPKGKRLEYPKQHYPSQKTSGCSHIERQFDFSGKIGSHRRCLLGAVPVRLYSG